METEFHTDVVVCGGGPAGASTALSLLRYTDRSVTIIEGSGFDQLKVGEQVSPAMFNVLSYLGIGRDALPENTISQGYTHLASWGSPQLLARHAINNVAGDSFQLDREYFDLLLVEETVAQGGRVLPQTRFVSAERGPSGEWELIARHKTRGQILIRAKYLVDATGRNGSLVRQLDLPTVQQDQLVGVGAFLEFNSDHEEIPEVVLETRPEGWWYSAPLPNGRMTVTLFTDADLVAELELNEQKNWLELLGQTHYIRQKSSAGKVGAGLWVRNAFTRLTLPSSIPGFLSVGDAALSIDPLSSIGIGFAMTSGCQAARALDADLKGQPEFVTAYKASLNSNFQEFSQRLRGYYAQEKRWPDAPFWARRVEGLVGG